MASDGSAPGSSVDGQSVIEGVAGASADDAPAKATFMQAPMRLRNPRGVGISHEGARTSNAVHVPELHNQREVGESDSAPELDHGNTFQDDNRRPRFAHLPQHIHDPRGARASSLTEEVNVDPVSANQATREANEARFSHLPRLHNPRGVNVVKQIQGRMSEESGHRARDEGDKL